jgi:hypothetical protein
MLTRDVAGVERTMPGSPAERQAMRAPMVRIAERLAVPLTSSDVEALVSRHVRTPLQIRQLRASGLSGDEILASLTS